MMPRLCLVSALLLLAAWPLEARPRSAEPPVAELYALAAAKLLGQPAGQELVVASTPAPTGSKLRARRASGEPRSADAAVASRVAELLARRGYRAIREGGQRRSPEVLRLILGELRFEPADRPTFARLSIGVVGSGGARETVEFLLKLERGTWRVIKSEIEGSIGVHRLPRGPWSGLVRA